MLLYLFRPYSLFASFPSLCKLSYLFFAFSFETPLVLRQYSAASSLPLPLWYLYFAFCYNSFLKLCGIKYKSITIQSVITHFYMNKKKSFLFICKRKKVFITILFFNLSTYFTKNKIQRIYTTNISILTDIFYCDVSDIININVFVWLFVYF